MSWMWILKIGSTKKKLTIFALKTRPTSRCITTIWLQIKPLLPLDKIFCPHPRKTRHCRGSSKNLPGSKAFSHSIQVKSEISKERYPICLNKRRRLIKVNSCREIAQMNLRIWRDLYREKQGCPTLRAHLVADSWAKSPPPPGSRKHLRRLKTESRKSRAILTISFPPMIQPQARGRSLKRRIPSPLAFSTPQTHPESTSPTNKRRSNTSRKITTRESWRTLRNTSRTPNYWMTECSKSSASLRKTLQTAMASTTQGTKRSTQSIPGRNPLLCTSMIKLFKRNQRRWSGILSSSSWKKKRNSWKKSKIYKGRTSSSKYRMLK